MSNDLVKYEAGGQEVTLSKDIVRKYLVNGAGNVTDQEVTMFLGLCKHRRLNPFTREVYLIKYGDRSPASVIVGKDAVIRRAAAHPKFRGFRAGVIYDAGDGMERTEGMLPVGAKLLGGWSEVQVDGWVYPLKIEVSLQEYLGKTRDGQTTGMWQTKPATMIRKVALVQGLREAFPEDLGGMHDESEMQEHGPLPEQHVTLDAEVVEPKPEPEPVAEGQEKQIRRRTKKYNVDPEEFGEPVLQTCGSTPWQLAEIKAGMKRHPKVKEAVDNLMADIGQTQLSFLREDEAAGLVEMVEALDVSEAPAPIPDDEEMIECPNTGDKIKKTYCLNGCATRKSMGFCPAIDEIPDGEMME